MEAWNKISRMPAAAIASLQDELLKKMLTGEIASRHPYYRERLAEHKIDPAQVKGVKDLVNLPFTVKEDIIKPGEKLQAAKKFVLVEPKVEVQKKKRGFSLFGRKDKEPQVDDYKFHTLYFSSGRTARPIPIEFTHRDLANLKEAAMRSFDILELTRDDTMINAFTYAPNAYFWQIFYGSTGVGSTALQAGGGKVLGMEKILKALDTMEAPALLAAPGYAMFALQTIKHFGLSASNLERIVIGIDYAPLVVVEKIRRLMEKVGTAQNRVQRIYSISEAKSAWAECEPGTGYHLNPDHVLVEIVDPLSGEVLAEGQGGEVVITHLDAAGTVLLRYRTGDYATGGLVTEPCPNCKRTVPRIMGDIERLAHRFALKGSEGEVSLDGNALRRALYGRDDVLLWYAELNNDNGADKVAITLKGVSGTDEESLLAELKEELQPLIPVSFSLSGSSLDAIANKIGLERFITEQLFFDNRH